MADLILVNQQDKVIGHKDKLACHLGKGILHRAFSIWLFNDKKQTLIQQRATDKLLWPGFWSNSCCSHPVKGEKLELTLQRRLKEELGIIPSVKLKLLYKFEYRAEYQNIGVEYELCYVYRGQYNGPIQPNSKEASAYRWLSLKDLKNEVEVHPEQFTPWMKMELERLNQ